jgi:superfamily I DNA/RNA helicase
LWSIFDRVRSDLAAEGLVTIPGAFARATDHLLSGPTRPFDTVVIDEAQDIGVPQLRFLAALAGDRADGLFFAGDLGQRIFQTPFSWRSLGVDVRGRSQTLRINYRTSHQIRRQADLLLPSELSDVDGNTEVRRGTVSAFNGPDPVIRTFESIEAESAFIREWFEAGKADGVPPHEMVVFVRSEAELGRAREAVKAAGLSPFVLDGNTDGEPGSVAVSTMHLAKGLEFRTVVVAACDDEILPLQARIQNVAEEADLEDAYETERHLLYVACTRARDHLLVTGVEPASEFLDDLRGDQAERGGHA